MTDLLANEFRRLIYKLPETDPSTHAYVTLLQSIEALDAIGSTIEGFLASCNGDCVDCPNCEEPKPAADTSAAEDFPPVDETPFPEPETKAEPEPKPEPENLSAAAVRARLAEARRDGVDIKAVLKGFGVDNFTALPASEYPALLSALKG